MQAFADLVRELRLGSPIQAGHGRSELCRTTPARSIRWKRRAARPTPSPSAPTAATRPSPARTRQCVSGTWKRTATCAAASATRRRCGAVAFSPDGTRLLSGGKDATLRLWDVATGRELRKFEGHDDLVTSIAFSPDGKRALSGGIEGEVFLWDLEKNKPLTEFTFGGAAKYIHHVTFAADGKRALVCADRSVYVIDAASGKVVQTLQGHSNAVVSAAFSADGRHILSGGDDRTMRLWDVVKGKQLRVFSGHESGVTSVVFSPDGRRSCPAAAMPQCDCGNWPPARTSRYFASTRSRSSAWCSSPADDTRFR